MNVQIESYINLKIELEQELTKQKASGLINFELVMSLTLVNETIANIITNQSNKKGA